ncbi:hypothetical protein ANCDUO_15807, partial [Ancylostoma duodenale]
MWTVHALFLAELTSFATSVYQMPLTRIEPQVVKMIRKGIWLNYNEGIEKKRINLVRERTMSTAFPHEVLDYYDTQYIGEVTIGTPEQHFQNPMDGVLGLAFEKIAISNVTPPIIRAMNLGLLDEPVFTVFLKHVG